MMNPDVPVQDTRSRGVLVMRVRMKDVVLCLLEIERRTVGSGDKTRFRGLVFPLKDSDDLHALLPPILSKLPAAGGVFSNISKQWPEGADVFRHSYAKQQDWPCRAAVANVLQKIGVVFPHPPKGASSPTPQSNLSEGLHGILGSRGTNELAVETISEYGTTLVTLKELLRPDLRAVFVGINPAPVSVAAGHFYQGRLGKRFWTRLQRYGLLSDLPPDREDEAAFVQGFGFADLVRRPTASAKELSANELWS